jgi:NAD(P)-dependent dehydrogenase (short-subunit alcohol dehydrogenase family)
MQNILITGTGSGIGRALAEEYIRRGDSVYSIGRNPPKSIMSHINFIFFPLDLSNQDLVHEDIREFVSNNHFEQVILNAGAYGRTERLVDTSMKAIEKIMNVNLWSNKKIIDTLLTHSQVDQITALGASPSIFDQTGFGSYALSKAALAGMIHQYAQEFPDVHFSTLAPELIQTDTLSQLLKSTDTTRFPHVARIRDRNMISPDQAAPLIIEALSLLRQKPSGSFVEMSKLNLHRFSLI